MKLNLLAKVQRLGATLMLPIAVLPIAGLLLRLGQPDVLNIALMAQAGDAVFANLALLFSIGVAVGLAKDNNGTAALAGTIGYLVLTAVLKTMDKSLNMGVLAGILTGVIAGLLYNRYRNITLPSYLGFFGGKRFVPIVTGLVCLVLGIVLAYIWAPVQAGINGAGTWLTTAGPIGAFVFGALNRLLVMTGLHHVINTLTWFVFGSYTDPNTAAVVTGDLHRYFAGDKTAGTFMTGFFPVMMFGLPAACLAMYHEAPRERRAVVGGLLFSMALTSFLTGITEPVEFSFMFLAPLLYGLHAVLTGLSLAICELLNIHLGFTFSAGAIDYVLGYGLSSNGWMALPLGAVYALVYYTVFRFCIRRFRLLTPGREPVAATTAEPEAVKPASGRSQAESYVLALGGTANLREVDSCTTRLRLSVVNADSVSESRLKALGAVGLLRLTPQAVQVVIGPQAERIADEIRAFMSLDEALQEQTKAAANDAQPVAPALVQGIPMEARHWIETLGGLANIVSVDQVAGSRLRVVVRKRPAGEVSGLMWVADDTAHIVLGHSADEYAAAFERALAGKP
ncbi:N-acetylglucosamine-specific PTS transporter subunit IIBC [Comamonas composti]|uniref:N-acetylglucosamine-specific PTS transporter subunit IIBC n=1 Tax=Comamonas composti TaxID=408558 RepID=UPI000404361F|nr:N-acetylglucosamine-specific PTS transporter subunit IIBC [Comamonas composti]